MTSAIAKTCRQRTLRPEGIDYVLRMELTDAPDGSVLRIEARKCMDDVPLCDVYAMRMTKMWYEKTMPRDLVEVMNDIEAAFDKRQGCSVVVQEPTPTRDDFRFTTMIPVGTRTISVPYTLEKRKTDVGKTIEALVEQMAELKSIVAGPKDRFLINRTVVVNHRLVCCAPSFHVSACILTGGPYTEDVHTFTFGVQAAQSKKTRIGVLPRSRIDNIYSLTGLNLSNFEIRGCEVSGCDPHDACTGEHETIRTNIDVDVLLTVVVALDMDEKKLRWIVDGRPTDAIALSAVDGYHIGVVLPRKCSIQLINASHQRSARSKRMKKKQQQQNTVSKKKINK
jgi:hypothetical protein